MYTQKLLLSITEAAQEAGFEPKLDPRCDLCVHSQKGKCGVVYAYERAIAIPGEDSEISEGAERILDCLIPAREHGNPSCSLFWPTLRAHR